MAEVRVLHIPEGLVGERADVGLSRMLGLSRSVVSQQIFLGKVFLDGKLATKSQQLVMNSLLEFEFPAAKSPAKIVPEIIEDLKIIYDDEEIVVVDKPVGVAAHPSQGWFGSTVIGGLAGAGYRISTSGVAERQGIVHRLDVGTSGLMVVAKSEHAYTFMKRAFKQRKVEKVYHALVQGLPDPLRGTIEAPIARHPKHDWRFCVLDGGKHAVTHYQLLEAFSNVSLLEINLETGRTHQIRVHFSSIKHPCVGDITYGADPVLAGRLCLDRQWLHAKKLVFMHPSKNELVSYESSYPEDLQNALDLLRV